MSFSCTAFTFPCEELHLDRKLVRRESQRLLREALADPPYHEEDLSRSDDADPVVGRALTGSHSHLCGLLGDRLVREHADPHLAATAEVMDDRAPRGLDLPRGHPARLLGLQCVLAEGDRAARDGVTLHAPALELAVLEPLRLKHYDASPPVPLVPLLPPVPLAPLGVGSRGAAGAAGAAGAGAAGTRAAGASARAGAAGAGA